MEYYYFRIAMAGWILLAVILSSVLELSDWELNKLFVLLPAKGDGAGFWALLFGAIAGVGAPPAVGFLLERVISGILRFCGWSLWNNKDVQAAVDSLTNVRLPQGTAIHVLFYTVAAEPFRSWARRRRTHMYASLTSGLAVVVGLLGVVAPVCLKHKAIPFIFGPIWVFFVIVLIAHGVREGRHHLSAIKAWVETLGRKEWTSLAKENWCAKMPADQRPDR